ncbi:MAG: hypothetical protein IPQ07_30225 [Myxococcales bacterium]|nr:hypothetical protein [Myxococcales bacterium]
MSGAIQAERTADRPDLGELTKQLYGHVMDAIDFAALFQLEQLLWSLLPDRGIHDEEGELASQLIAEAIVRASKDPARHISFVPPGITKAEAKAVDFDEHCPFCQLEAAAPSDDHDHGGEPCALCDDLARMWREEHAEVLRKRGVRSPARR